MIRSTRENVDHLAARLRGRRTTAGVAALWLLGRIDWRSALAPGGGRPRFLRLREQHPQHEADAPERE